jgi:Gly-Xaa carboxypeptidase
VEKYGKNSMALLVDEGGQFQDRYQRLLLIPLIGLFAEIGGSVIFLVGTAEKGLLDTKLTVMTPGGHSSVPPPHTVTFPVALKYRV